MPTQIPYQLFLSVKKIFKIKNDDKQNQHNK